MKSAVTSPKTHTAYPERPARVVSSTARAAEGCI